MEKNYDHNGSEDAIYAKWEKAGVMTADASSTKKSYTIPLPPPNVTGQLHLGHAAMLAVEDILIRYKKMTGHETLWIPGTDHAAIATENVVLKHLGMKTREEMTRKEFLTECRKFAGEKHDRITHQIKKMGAHLDWTREAYTFDSERNFAVNSIFKKLYEDGLIVRGHRMVNWSVGAQSVLADDEVEWEDNQADFYEFWCGAFLIGTVRTETKCADSPVVVHPEAEYVRAVNAEEKECVVTKKYYDEHTQLRKDFQIKEVVLGEELVGEEFTAETYAGPRKFWVIADEIIDPDFGTGAMTISASHSPDDFELAQRRDLPLIQKIDFAGTMTDIAGPCAGMPVHEARKRAGEILEEKGLLFEKRPHPNRVPKCYRSGTIVEPMLSPQWFISVGKEFTDEFSGKKTTLKRLMQEAVREDHVKIVPKRFEKVYFQWIDNLRDWCISRQIWWGHRIPVWYDKEENIYLPVEKNILFARHGESEANAKKIIGGDYPLTDSGLQDAHKIAEEMREKGVKKVICSDSKRGKQTAKIVAAELNIPFEIWSELAEFTSSELAGKANLKREGSFEIQLDGVKDEELIDISRRAQNVVERLKKEDDILVIGHKNFTAAIFHFSRSEDEEKFIRFRSEWKWAKGEIRALTVLADPVVGQQISFVRHGESEWNKKGLVQGQSSGNILTEKGRSQARDMAQKLKGKNIQKIVSSDLDRAKETAEILRTELGIKASVELWEELREWNTGTATGKTIQEVFGGKKFDFEQMIQKFETGELGAEAETLEKLFARSEKVFEKLKKEKNVLVISHGGILGTLDKYSQDGHMEGLSEFFKKRSEQKNAEELILPTERLTQDKDTLDTWFSSALWPFSTLGWPDETPDFEKFYPTDVLETGHDILFFWVARMIMFGRYATGKYPFHTVYLHGLVCDENGQKMSKSKGNGIDPLEVISEVGADAVRLSLVIGATAGNPIPLGKSKITGYRNFVNKMWNAGRFVQMQVESEPGIEPSLTPVSLSEKWLLHRLSEVSASVSQKLDKYEISAAGDEIYHFVWDEFCSWFLETQKVDKNPVFLYGVFLEVLKLSHPLVPFITETLWEEMGPKGSFLIEQEFPSLKGKDKEAVQLFILMQEMVTEIRKVRAEKKLNPKDKISVKISAGKRTKSLQETSEVMKVLANLSDIEIAEKVSKPERAAMVLVEGMEIFVEVPFDVVAEKKRLENEITTLEKSVAALTGRLANKAYTDKAPEHLVAQTKQQLADAEGELKTLQGELRNL